MKMKVEFLVQKTSPALVYIRIEMAKFEKQNLNGMIKGPNQRSIIKWQN